MPEVTTISNKDGAALNTTAAPEVTAALETANKLDEAYGKWTVKDEAVTTATKRLSLHSQQQTVYIPLITVILLQ